MKNLFLKTNCKLNSRMKIVRLENGVQSKAVDVRLKVADVKAADVEVKVADVWAKSADVINIIIRVRVHESSLTNKNDQA